MQCLVHTVQCVEKQAPQAVVCAKRFYAAMDLIALDLSLSSRDTVLLEHLTRAFENAFN